MQPQNLQILPTDIKITDINSLTITSNLLPSDLVDAQLAIIDSETVNATTQDINIATYTDAIDSRTIDIDGYQSLIVESQTSKDASIEKIKAAQDIIDKVTSVLPELTPVAVDPVLDVIGG